MLEVEGAAPHAGDVGAATPTLAGIGRGGGATGSAHRVAPGAAAAPGTPCPFPRLQEHILACADKRAAVAAGAPHGAASINGCRPGRECDLGRVGLFAGYRHEVRSWVYFAEKQLLVLSVANQGFCGNVERAHKSNGVMYVADLRRGCFYQKCYDPDCRAYTSNEFTVPEGMGMPELGGARSQLQCHQEASGELCYERTGTKDAPVGETVALEASQVANDQGDGDCDFWAEAARSAQVAENLATDLLAIA